jgi:hypothetical protein
MITVTDFKISEILTRRLMIVLIRKQVKKDML